MSSERLIYLPLGGAGEIGMNCYVYGWGKPGDWWRSSKSISGGLTYDWGVHLLEYTLQIVRSEVTEVTGFSWNGIWSAESAWKKDANEDDAMLAVRYASGAWSTLAYASERFETGVISRQYQ